MVQRAGQAGDAPCLVCGEPLQGPLACCDRCETPHHQDCWEWNGGCGVYGCRRVAPRVVPTEDEDGVVTPGKLGMPVKQTGSYAGVWFVPLEEAALAFAIELLSFPFFWAGDYLTGGLLLLAVFLVMVWIAFMSTRYYVDFEQLRITRAKAILGYEYWESEIAPLEDFQALEVQGVPGTWHPVPTALERKDPDWVPHYRRYRIVAMMRPSRGAVSGQVTGEPLELSLPLPVEDPAMREVADMFRRIQASQAFPVVLPRVVRRLPPPAKRLLPEA